MKQYSVILIAIIYFICMIGGCKSYTTPGGGADLTAMSDFSLREVLERKPVSPVPVNLTIVRVQAPGYSSRTVYSSYGYGEYSVVTIHDIEKKEHMDRLESLPDVTQLGTLNRLLLPSRLQSAMDLRKAAAALHSDMLLIYTVDTDFEIDDAVAPLSVITLGFSPTQTARVATTASAILIDVRTGYVYGACEGDSQKAQLASAWTNEAAVDQSRLTTESQAFEKMLDSFESMWSKVIKQRRLAMKK